MRRRELPAYEVLFRRGRARPAALTALALLAVGLSGTGTALAFAGAGEGGSGWPASLVAATLIALALALGGLVVAGRQLGAALRDRSVTVYGDPSGLVLGEAEPVGPIPWRAVAAIRPVGSWLAGGIALSFHRPKAVFEDMGAALAPYRRRARGADHVVIRRALLDAPVRKAAGEIRRMWEMYR